MLYSTGPVTALLNRDLASYMENNKKKALIVVDVQNDFCPGGSLAVAQGDQVVAPLNRLITEFLDGGEPVVKTRDWHPAETRHFADYGGAWPVHCVQNTPGAEFHADLLHDPRINHRSIFAAVGWRQRGADSAASVHLPKNQPKT